MNRGVGASMSGTNHWNDKADPQLHGSSLSPCRPCDGGEGICVANDDVLEEVGV
jgi:hypothetical protein